MNVSAPFIERPVGTTLLMFGLSLAGVLAYLALPVAALPQVDYPTVVVATQLPGASAETIAATVTTPLERQLGQIAGLAQITSVSSFASSQITLQFRLDRNIDAAEQDVQAALNAAASLLPVVLPTPPTYSKSNPADTPVLSLAARSDTLALRAVDDYADSVLAQKISQVAGVGLVSLGGGQKPAIRLQVNPEALATTGLTLEDVRQAVVAANVNQPKGSLDGPRQAYALATDDQLLHAQAYREMIIAYRNGMPLRLAQVADVVEGAENEELAGWANTQRAIILNVQRQPGANLIDVADRVKALLPSLAKNAPKGIAVEVLTDRTQTIRASLHEVQQTLLLTIALVVAVIFFFLQDGLATLIPSVTVPLSLLGTFGLMYFAGYSLDNLSLMALTICTGFVVDDAIVMIENISRYLEANLSPREAAHRGAKQIGFTIVSLTVSLVAVLIPLLLMGGIVGRLFREFAMTLAFAIGVSALLSLSVTPMMCAQLLKPAHDKTPSRWAKLSEGLIIRWSRGYARSLAWALAHRRITFSCFLSTVGITIGLAMAIPKGFFPAEDTGLVVGTSQADSDISFTAMLGRQRALAEALLADPDVANIASFIGSDGVNPTRSSGRLVITLRGKTDRVAPLATTLANLSARADAVAGVALFLQPVQDLQVDARASRTQYQYTLEGPSADQLDAVTPQVVTRLRSLGTLRDVSSDRDTAVSQAHLTIDRDTAFRLGITMQAIDDTLYDAFGQRIISTMFTQLNQYRVILQVQPSFAQGPEALRRLYVRGSAGQPVPLSAITTLTLDTAPQTVNHQGQFPSATVSFNLAPGASLGAATTAIDAAVAELGLPPSVRGRFQGAAQAFADSLASQPYLLLAALVTVYIVLGVLYESYAHPITILSSLPSAGTGALAALWAMGMDFDVLGLIGIVLLIGIVKKNAIMMVDFALELQREQHRTPADAIYEASVLRFRPIMMTTLAALIGALPLAMQHGIGAELRRPLGVCIVGGLLLSQVLTLYTTPVIYLYVDACAHALGRLHSRWFGAADTP